jgi:hypothetical protein
MAHDTTRLQELGEEQARLRARLAEITPEFHREIYAARDAGIGPVEVARLGRVTRDAVGQLMTKRDRAKADQ